jgi:anti-sigma factor RsiW
MKCERVREGLLDVATGVAAPPEVEEHLRGCEDCRRRAGELRATMTVLGEWPEVEPSPYFDARLRARVREQAAAAQGWWAWVRRPALAAVFVLLIAAGVGLFQRTQPQPESGIAAVQAPAAAVTAKIGTAVSDLQALDRNEDLYANFDLLDDMSTPDNTNSRAQ